MKLPAWSLVQFTTSQHGVPRIGVYADDVVRSAPTALAGKTLLDVLADWNRWLPEIHNIVPASLDAVPDATIIAPLTYPKAVLCVGANYYGQLGTGRDLPGLGNSTSPVAVFVPGYFGLPEISFASTVLSDGDRIEIVAFVGGG